MLPETDPAPTVILLAVLYEKGQNITDEWLRRQVADLPKATSAQLLPFIGNPPDFSQAARRLAEGSKDANRQRHKRIADALARAEGGRREIPVAGTDFRADIINEASQEMTEVKSVRNMADVDHAIGQLTRYAMPGYARRLHVIPVGKMSDRQRRSINQACLKARIRVTWHVDEDGSKPAPPIQRNLFPPL